MRIIQLFAPNRLRLLLASTFVFKNRSVFYALGNKALVKEGLPVDWSKKNKFDHTNLFSVLDYVFLVH
ncbi:hypothetical protein LJB97_03320 [Parabacteroides sp. OttesenSCG-928-O15]|nr:hypothetical protein [Parabacteroides sp. OttesenSCG-928-O15]